MSTPHQQHTGTPPPPPPPIARTWLRYVLTFGVTVVVGLAPYLGRYRVPLFSPLLDLIPETIQDAAITLSAAMMGIVAVVVQYYGSGQLSRQWLGKIFRRTLWFGLATFILLAVVHVFTVVSMPIHGENPKSYLVGFKRPHRDPCPAEVSDAKCIELLTVNPAAIASFWGDTQIRLAKLSLIFSYVSFTSSFGILAGLLVMQRLLATRAK